MHDVSTDTWCLLLAATTASSVAAATIAASGVEGVIVALGIVFLFKSISLVVLLFRLCLFSLTTVIVTSTLFLFYLSFSFLFPLYMIIYNYISI